MRLLPFAVGLALLACQSPHREPAAQKGDSVLPAAVKKAAPDTTTLGGGWYLQPVLPADTASGKTPTLQLDLAKSRFTGNTGCNSMRGRFWSDKTDSSLSFGDKIVMTRMACTGYNEAAFLKSLKNVTHYRLNNGMLILLSDERTELSHWMRKPASGPKALKA
ncbi:MAG TPA: META domain-containing protein [Puia sp.]|uniref:META domain-containing protein n=1 Tax=Puia sp. TaxID=2045100 RepID=UPI002C4C3230|nr:META domain-containing protein [Puia sp.]HVU97261.1 META domain-containing protein [Puia sp.]